MHVLFYFSHSNIDYDTLANNSRSIIDTRNVFKDYKESIYEDLVKDNYTNI